MLADILWWWIVVVNPIIIILTVLRWWLNRRFTNQVRKELQMPTDREIRRYIQNIEGQRLDQLLTISGMEESEERKGRPRSGATGRLGETDK